MPRTPLPHSYISCFSKPKSAHQLVPASDLWRSVLLCRIVVFPHPSPKFWWLSSRDGSLVSVCVDISMPQERILYTQWSGTQQCGCIVNPSGIGHSGFIECCPSVHRCACRWTLFTSRHPLSRGVQDFRAVTHAAPSDASSRLVHFFVTFAAEGSTSGSCFSVHEPPGNRGGIPNTGSHLTPTCDETNRAGRATRLVEQAEPSGAQGNYVCAFSV